jgi:hypothetical protein
MEKTQLIVHALRCLVVLSIIAYLGMACSADNSSDDSGSQASGEFAIYLIEAGAIDWNTYGSMREYLDALGGDLDQIPLQDEPAVKMTDIVSYNWANHRIELTPEGHNQLNAAFQSSAKDGFVVVANGEPIYLGAFMWYLTSNYTGTGFPAIAYWDEMPNPLTIQPAGDVASGADPEDDVRNDERIRNVLQHAGVVTK